MVMNVLLHQICLLYKLRIKSKVLIVMYILFCLVCALHSELC